MAYRAPTTLTLSPELARNPLIAALKFVLDIVHPLRGFGLIHVGTSPCRSLDDDTFAVINLGYVAPCKDDKWRSAITVLQPEIRERDRERVLLKGLTFRGIEPVVKLRE